MTPWSFQAYVCHHEIYLHRNWNLNSATVGANFMKKFTNPKLNFCEIGIYKPGWLNGPIQTREIKFARKIGWTSSGRGVTWMLSQVCSHFWTASNSINKMRCFFLCSVSWIGVQIRISLLTFFFPNFIHFSARPPCLWQDKQQYDHMVWNQGNIKHRCSCAYCYASTNLNFLREVSDTGIPYIMTMPIRNDKRK